MSEKNGTSWDWHDPTLGLKIEPLADGAKLSLELTERIRPELQTYPLYRMSQAQAGAIYAWHKRWAGEHKPPPEELERILKSHTSAMDRPYLAPIVQRVAEIAQAQAKGQPATVIELGGANAALLHWWPESMPSIPLRYTGIEPFQPFVEHAAKQFPDARFVHGDAETFLDLNLAPLKPVTAFVAATVFCFIHPEVVRRCFLKAAQLTDDILIRDYLLNVQGGLVPAGHGHLAFDYFRTPEFPTLFAHRFEEYFQEIGFGVVHMEEARTDVDLPGWALVHARRIKT